MNPRSRIALVAAASFVGDTPMPPWSPVPDRRRRDGLAAPPARPAPPAPPTPEQLRAVDKRARRAARDARNARGPLGRHLDTHGCARGACAQREALEAKAGHRLIRARDFIDRDQAPADLWSLVERAEARVDLGQPLGRADGGLLFHVQLRGNEAWCELVRLAAAEDVETGAG